MQFELWLHIPEGRVSESSRNADDRASVMVQSSTEGHRHAQEKTCTICREPHQYASGGEIGNDMEQPLNDYIDTLNY